MSEQQLRRVLHEAAITIEVPSDLFPRERLLAEERPFHRRLTAIRPPREARTQVTAPAGRRWTLAVAAAAAVILAVTGFTPLGRAAVQKLGEVFMAFRVQEMDVAEWEELQRKAPPLPPEGWTPIQPGEVRTYPQPPESFRKPNILRGFTVQALQERYADHPWPLPTYLPPAQEQSASVMEHYDVYEDPEYADLNLSYKVNWKGREHRIALNIWRPLKFYAPGPPFPNEQTIELPPGALQSVQAVEVKGITATAYKDGDWWTIAWYAPELEKTKFRAASRVSSTLPLEELIKVVESLPTWD